MSGGKGGGGIDTGPMIEYGNKALALQRNIYQQTREDAQPWYQAGSGAISQLQTLLGIPGGTGMKTREQLIKELTPQYTTNTGNSGNYYISNDGRLIDLSAKNFGDVYMSQNPRGKAGGFSAGLMNASNAALYNKYGESDRLSLLNKAGYKPYSSQTSSINYDSLNAAVEAALAEQAAQGVPEGYGSLLERFDLSKFEEEPGYQFRLAEGNKALERKLNAAGKTFSPEAAKALQSYGQGLASEEYGNAYNRYNIDQQNIYNRLAGLAGMGQAASGQLAGAGQNYAQGGTDLYTGMGNAITSANVARAQQGSSMFNTLLGVGGQLGSAYLFSDERLKENIVPLGTENGYPIYKFNYINIPEKTYIGVMAQDVEKIKPEAVQEVDGMKQVNYGMIGVQMREVYDAS